MPISDEALQNEKNRFVAVKGEATVGQAIAALQNLNGQPWWHLIVRQENQSWAAARFTDLYQSLERMPLGRMASVFDVALNTWQGLTPISAIERDSIETRAAQTLARKSPGRLVVVTVNGAPVGILVEGVRRSSGALGLTSPNLDQLGGKYVKLKDYGSILLGSSRK